MLRKRAGGVGLACSIAVGMHAWAESSSPDALAEVIVTGSRIPTLAANETLSISVLDATDLARGGLDSLGKLLQTLPQSATAVLNTNVNNGGNGSQRVDLRSLQPKRTLVLLNGRRLPNGGLGGDDAVDLNSLPAVMIDRVEILTGGASAIYGADAVAGVVNLITKTSYQGVDLRAERSVSSRYDGGISNFSLAAGHELFGGQWMMGAEYVDQQSVSQADRAFSATPLTIIDAAGTTALNGSTTVPDGFFRVPAGNALGLPPGRYTHVAGTSGRTATDYRLFNINADSFNYAPYTYLQTPNERASAWLMGTQPLSSRISLHVEALYDRRRSAQRFAPTPFSTAADVSPLLADGSTGIPANNYYNPFGVDLRTVRRRLTELPERGAHQRVELHRELLALQVSLGDWKIEPAVSLSESTATETDSGSIPGQRFATAVGPSGPDAQGQIVCGVAGTDGIVPASAIIPNCVPIDLFGGAGSITPQQVAGIQQTLIDHGRNSQRLAGVTAQGPFGSAPGGAIQWAAGAEYRRDQGAYEFDPERGGGAVGSGGQNSVPDVAITTREIYLETRVPLVRNRHLADALDASGGLRYTDSSFGGHLTWQTGLRWQPQPSIGLRGNYARVFRAPTLAELYKTSGISSNQTSDPCGNLPNPTQQAHCAANGVPGGAYVQDPNDSVTFLTGGNPRLAPETGHSLSAGLDLRPSPLPGLRLSLDYYQISLDGAIEGIDGETVLQQCADGGVQSICGLIQRASDGSVQTVSVIPQNFGHITTSGIDLATQWRHETIAGEFRASLQSTYLVRFDTQLAPGSVVSSGAGTYSIFALPRWRGLAHLDFERGPWFLTYSMQWIGGFHECGRVDFDPTQPLCRAIPSVFYHDLEAAFTLRSALTLRLGVTNLSDSQPPYLNFGNDANTDTSIYRLLGRTYYAAFRWQLR